jgi:rhamnosyltransferase
MNKVSIIVRSYNDIDLIEQTMKMILSQSYQDYEIINVDCSSTDGTQDIIKKYNTKGKIFTINPKDYVPGVVLNSMLKECSGEIVVFNNSDCVPVDNNWLKELIDPFNDSEVAASFGNQLTRSDAKLLIVKDNTRAFGDGKVSSKWKHFFSLATSAARLSVFNKNPFNEKIQYSEDIEWSYRIKNMGMKIVYCENAKVEHSHNYTLKEVKKRFYSEGYAEALIYKENVSFFMGFFKPLCMEILRDFVYLLKKGKIFTIPYGVVYRIIQKYNIYKGRSDFFKGKILWPHLQK